MNKTFHSISGSVTAPKGFLASGVFCDVKTLGTGKGSNKGAKRDLAVLFSERPARAAGLFTTNQVKAAPVKLDIERIRKGTAQAVVANSGNANACTGAQGDKDAAAMARQTAEALNVPEQSVLVCSTGRIGLPLPMDNVKRGIEEAARTLSATRRAASRAAEAILTSDSKRKEIAVEFKLSGKTARIGAMAKGAGMIQPGMSPDGRRPASAPLHATMLCFIATDADVAPAVLRQCLKQAVAQSFNRITVDGDMSTNDTVLLLANGLAGNKPIARANDKDGAVFQQALDHVTLHLAKMIARDGEGVSRVINLFVDGARSAKDADAAARAIGNSQLVKTSWCGGDPNWGRIMDALGYSDARVSEEKVDLGYALPGDRKILWALRRGRPTTTPLNRLRTIARRKEFDLHLRLNLGTGAARLHASDLTEAYVDFNKGE